MTITLLEKLHPKAIDLHDGDNTCQVLYATVPCGLGWFLVASTKRGICKLTLGDALDELIADLKIDYGNAKPIAGNELLAKPIATIAQYLNGERPDCNLPLDVKGTTFENKVWDELKSIPYGQTRSYSDVAKAIGQPKAFRAVAQACGRNPVSLIIPCHRVLRSGGELGGYHWGIMRKKALLEMEKAKSIKAS
jgi:AraC family transcriptional regulator of adaptative response/methylated-DNA-[protein]-cysteine methyltransferase